MLKNYPYPKVIAHRGAGKDAPENTLAAFRLGAQSGYNMFECDVKLSRNKELFLHHDDTLMRTTNGEGLPNHYDWQELSRLDAGSWHSVKYAGESLARFDSLVTYILANAMQLDVEIKPNSGEEYETGVAVAQFLAQKKALTHETYPFMLSSFQPEALKGAKESTPEIPRALLVDDFKEGEEKVLQILDELECAGIITNYKIITEELINQCHAVGRFVMVYTANEPDEIKRLLSIGVDSVITDNMAFITHFF